MVGIFFLSLLHVAPSGRIPLTKPQRCCPGLLLSESKARRAKRGEKSQGSHQRGCGDRAGHKWVWRKDMVIPWKTWKTTGISAGPQPALRCGVESKDQDRPSHFPWLFLGHSFDLFLRKTAETQGIESRCLAAAGHGARGTWPGSSSHQSGGQDVTTPSPPAPPAPAGREGARWDGKKQQRAPSPPLASRPRCLTGLFCFNGIREGCVCVFISGCCVPRGPSLQLLCLGAENTSTTKGWPRNPGAGCKSPRPAE